MNDIDALEGVVTMKLLDHTGRLPRCRYPGHLGDRDPVEEQKKSKHSSSLRSAYGSGNKVIHGVRDPIVCIYKGLSLRPAHNFARNIAHTLRAPASQVIHRRPRVSIEMTPRRLPSRYRVSATRNVLVENHNHSQTPSLNSRRGLANGLNSGGARQ